MSPTTTSAQTDHAKNQNQKWAIAGATLVALVMTMAWLSTSFGYEKSAGDEPVVSLVVLLMAAGAVYFAIAILLAREQVGRGLLIFIIAVGVLCRLFMFPTDAMLEDDYYRYLWDGGVLANGYNPYKYAPQDALAEPTGDFPPALHELANDSSPVAARVNHPKIRTIYPPVAQAAFVLAYWLKPWSMVAWRAVLLGFDLVTLALLIIALRSLRLPLGLVSIYWWNPLLVKDFYNSGHMDLVIFPFVMGALVLAIKKRPVWAAGALALGVGVKVWPALLLPIVIRPLLKRPLQLLLALALFGTLSLAMFLPILAGGLDPDSGFNAYGSRWEMNDALFMLILWGVRFWCRLLDAGDYEFITRMLVGLIIVGGTLWVARKDAPEPSAYADRFLFVVAAVFLLSPTQFSWYSLWMLPLLAVRPRASLLLLTVLIPMYYLRFYFKAQGRVGVHDYGVVWFEFVPVWLLLIGEFIKPYFDALRTRKALSATDEN